MRIKDISYETLNSYKYDQLLEVALEEIPKARHNIESIERNLGSSQAVRAINEQYPEGLPYNSTIKQMSMNKLRSLVFSARSFMRDKTSTLKGARETLNQIMISSGYKNEELAKFKRHVGGYRGFEKILDIVDDIRQLSPSLMYTVSSDGTKMEAMLIAVEELGTKDISKLSQRAREIYERLQLENEQKNEFPFTI